MDMLLEFYLEEAAAAGAEGLKPEVYELPWGVAAEPAGYRWQGWAFLQRRDGALPEHFFEKLPPACRQMPVGLHLELSWEGLGALEAPATADEAASRRASFAELVRALLSGRARWVVAFWSPSNAAVHVDGGDADAVVGAVLATLRQGGAQAERGWVLCRCEPGAGASTGGAAASLPRGDVSPG
jgi:hypothetical protein